MGMLDIFIHFSLAFFSRNIDSLIKTGKIYNMGNDCFQLIKDWSYIKEDNSNIVVIRNICQIYRNKLSRLNFKELDRLSSGIEFLSTGQRKNLENEVKALEDSLEPHLNFRNRKPIFTQSSHSETLHKSLYDIHYIAIEKQQKKLMTQQKVSKDRIILQKNNHYFRNKYR